MSFFTFIISKDFFRHLGYAVIVIVVLLVISFFSINLYTHHGESIQVPDFSGMTFNAAQQLAEDKDLKVEISDSVHFLEKEKGAVVSQVPEPASKVKSDRTIYLIVNGLDPEKIPMPDLTGISVRQATADAELFGLKIGRLSYVPDISTTVIEQKFKGKQVPTGSLILKGAVIDLVVGKGESNEKTFIPNVIGLTYSEAEQKLASLSLNMGSASYDKTVITTKDTIKSRIWKQFPVPGSDNQIKLGSYIDIWFTMDNDLIPESSNENPPVDDL
jgi:eukaryotic-like serine/threonine-protein kinase